MKIRRIIEITLPDGAKNWRTMRPITEDQAIAAVCHGAGQQFAEMLFDGMHLVGIGDVFIVTEAAPERGEA